MRLLSRLFARPPVNAHPASATASEVPERPVAKDVFEQEKRIERLGSRLTKDPNAMDDPAVRAELKALGGIKPPALLDTRPELSLEEQLLYRLANDAIRRNDLRQAKVFLDDLVARQPNFREGLITRADVFLRWATTTRRLLI